MCSTNSPVGMSLYLALPYSVSTEHRNDILSYLIGYEGQYGFCSSEKIAITCFRTALPNESLNPTIFKFVTKEEILIFSGDRDEYEVEGDTAQYLACGNIEFLIFLYKESDYQKLELVGYVDLPLKRKRSDDGSNDTQ